MYDNADAFMDELEDKWGKDDDRLTRFQHRMWHKLRSKERSWR
jgi:hypothetical protein